MSKMAKIMVDEGEKDTQEELVETLKSLGNKSEATSGPSRVECVDAEGPKSDAHVATEQESQALFSEFWRKYNPLIAAATFTIAAATYVGMDRHNIKMELQNVTNERDGARSDLKTADDFNQEFAKLLLGSKSHLSPQQMNAKVKALKKRHNQSVAYEKSCTKALKSVNGDYDALNVTERSYCEQAQKLSLTGNGFNAEAYKLRQMQEAHKKVQNAWAEWEDFYVIKSGETLESVAKEYGLSPGFLGEVNLAQYPFLKAYLSGGPLKDRPLPNGTKLSVPKKLNAPEQGR